MFNKKDTDLISYELQKQKTKPQFIKPCSLSTISNTGSHLKVPKRRFSHPRDTNTKCWDSLKYITC